MLAGSDSNAVRNSRAPERNTGGGDVVAPLIRDLGARWPMDGNDAETVRMVLNAQMGKAGPPMDGRELPHRRSLLGESFPRRTPEHFVDVHCRMAMAFFDARAIRGWPSSSLVKEVRRLVNGTRP